MNKNNVLALVAIALMIVGVSLVIGGCNKAIGVGGWGPTNTQTIHVTDKKIDIKGTSYYMVYGTVNGVTKVFEVNNGFLLGIWNADEIYASINVGSDYEIISKGKKRVNMFMQEYPYITKVSKLDTNVTSRLEM